MKAKIIVFLLLLLFVSTARPVYIESVLPHKTGGGTTFLVAASDASAFAKIRADYHCDGIADDVQINSAITATYAVGGGKVSLSEGTFHTVASIDVNSSVWLGGCGLATVIDTNSTLNGSLIYALSEINVTISDMLLKHGDANSGPAALHFNDVNGFGISNLSIAGSSGDGIRLYNSCKGTVSDIIIEDSGSHSIMIAYDSDHIAVENIVSLHPANEHFCIEHQLSGQDNDHITLNNLVGITASNHGIFVRDAQYVTISNCIVKDSAAHGIHIGKYGGQGGASKIVVDNFIVENTTVANMDGVHIDENVTDVIISNGYIEDMTGHGVYIGDNTSRVTVSNCSIKSTTTYDNFFIIGDDIVIEGCSTHGGNIGVSIQTNSNHVLVSNNNFMDWVAYIARFKGDDVLFINNISNHSGSPPYFLYMDDTCSNIRFMNNDFRETPSTSFFNEEAGAQYYFEDNAGMMADARTIADSGDGNPATLTLVPKSNYIELTCNDANNCTITMGETGMWEGQKAKIVNVSANVCDFADTANVSELAGAFAAGQYDSLELVYLGDRWVEITRSASTLTAATAIIDTTTLVVNVTGYEDKVGIGTSSPNSIFHIKANIPGTVGSHPAGQIIIQNPADSVVSNVVITAYESDGNGNPDQQLWYLGSASISNSDITFLNRRNAELNLGTNGVSRVTILGNGNVGIGETAPQDKLEVNGTALFKGAVKYTQDDGNEFISGAVADGYMDYGATTGHRFDNNVNVTGNVEVSGVVTPTTDVMYPVKTVVKTIDVNDDDASDDFRFDNDVADQAEQSVDLGAIIPAYAEVVSVQLRCFETVTSSGAMSIDLGTASGGAELLAAANIDTANDIDGTATGAGPKLEAANAAKNVWINATPGANWNTLSEGRWAVMVTYIDYGAVYTWKNP